MSTSSSPCSGGSLTSGKSRRRELVCALPCLPPLCTVIHVCINLGTNILILAPECMYEAIDVQDQRRTLVFVIPHPPLIFLVDFCVVVHGMLSLHRNFCAKRPFKQQNQTKNIPTLRLCSTSSQEESSGEITTESTYAGVGRRK